MFSSLDDAVGACVCRSRKKTLLIQEARGAVPYGQVVLQVAADRRGNCFTREVAELSHGFIYKQYIYVLWIQQLSL